MNAIKIRIENKTGNILKLIFNNINIEKYFFKIKDEEIHIHLEKAQYNNFFNELMTGKEFKEVIDSNIEYYMIFLTLFAFNKQKDTLDINTFEDLEKSNCIISLICWDVTNIVIFSKSIIILDKIKENLNQNSIQYKDLTEEEIKNIKF